MSLNFRNFRNFLPFFQLSSILTIFLFKVHCIPREAPTAPGSPSAVILASKKNHKAKFFIAKFPKSVSPLRAGRAVVGLFEGSLFGVLANTGCCRVVRGVSSDSPTRRLYCSVIRFGYCLLRYG